MKPMHPAPSGGRVRLGARLRASRQAQGLTIEQVAAACKLTRGFLSRVERDETSPSVATLTTLCEVLSLPVGSLFEATASAVTRLQEAPLINMGGQRVTERLLTPRGQPRVQLLRSSLEPGAHGGEALYTVNSEVEVLHVLSGQVRVRFSDRSMDLLAGDTLSFPGREPHTWNNAGPEPAEVLWVLAPAPWSGSS